MNTKTKSTTTSGKTGKTQTSKQSTTTKNSLSMGGKATALSATKPKVLKTTMGDKEYVNDFIAGQKMVTSAYNTFANECTNDKLRLDFMKILKEEHDIQFDLFNVMQKKGWYQVQDAEQKKIQQAKQKFSSMM